VKQPKYNPGDIVYVPLRIEDYLRIRTVKVAYSDSTLIGSKVEIFYTLEDGTSNVSEESLYPSFGEALKSIKN
jgi:hypothetical protein